jgi:hypothetical protein
MTAFIGGKASNQRAEMISEKLKFDSSERQFSVRPRREQVSKHVERF